MISVSAELWADLVRVYEAAVADSDLAFAAYDRLPPAGSGDTDEERRYDAARAIMIEHEDRLLAVKPPSLGAAAYQLKLFGLRYHFVDMDEPPMAGEDIPAGPILRSIHDTLPEISR